MSRTKDIVVTKFRAFCQHSTIHGVYYFHKSGRWTVHLTWVTIILASLMLCTFLSRMIWMKFVIDPTFTVVNHSDHLCEACWNLANDSLGTENRAAASNVGHQRVCNYCGRSVLRTRSHLLRTGSEREQRIHNVIAEWILPRRVESTRYSVSELPFPAVSVCDSGTVYGPNTANITDIFERRGFSHEEIKAFYESIEAVKRMNYIPKNSVVKMHGLLASLGMPYQDLLNTVKKPCEILLVECAWRSMAHNCSDMFREVHTFQGYCCQFDIPYFRANSKGVAYSSGIESTEGLIVTINTDAVAPTGNMFNSTVQLYLLDHKASITLLDSAITLTASTFYDVNVQVWAIDSSENVKSLSIDSRKCSLNSDQGADFYQGCITVAILQKVVETCRCLPFHYTSEDLKVAVTTKCSWDRMFCVYGALDSVLMTLKDITVESGCYQKCDYIEYDTNVRYIRQKRKLTTNDHSTFLVHFADNSCMKYRREVLYSWDQMLANLGGIFGLCVGGSIISIIELLWFICDLIYSIFMQKKVTPENKFNKKDFAAKLSPVNSKNNFKKKLVFVH